MSDKYGVEADPYCYPNTTVLQNKLSILDENILAQAERDFSTLNASLIVFAPPSYDLAYLCQIHKTLFSDLYDWAGELRSIDISKGETRFCNLAFIEKEANKIFTNLQKDNYLVVLEYDIS